MIKTPIKNPKLKLIELSFERAFRVLAEQHRSTASEKKGILNCRCEGGNFTDVTNRYNFKLSSADF